MQTPGPQDIPIQPVNKPILCSPYDEPTEHWVYDTQTGAATLFPGQRPAGYWFKTRRTGDATLMLKGFAEEERDDLPPVNRLRADVKRWRQLDYEGATPVTRQLLHYWVRTDPSRRLFFCLREAGDDRNSQGNRLMKSGCLPGRAVGTR